MAQITSNQHSYSNAYALLSVNATAVRSGTDKVNITANWTIYTAGSSYNPATRYLVLYVGSEDGAKYYSTAIRSSWEKETTYTGSYTFVGVPLAAWVTSITIGFGVSAANTYITSSGTFIWNGGSQVSHSSYDPDIQFGTITGIAEGITSCTAPTSFTVSPEIFDNSVQAEWSGAVGGVANSITGYILQYSTKTEGGDWSVWTPFWSGASSPATFTSFADLVARGGYLRLAIRTIGSAGESYYSNWAISNTIQRRAYGTARIHNGTEAKEYGALIHNGVEAKRYTPYRYDGTHWVTGKN